MALLEVRDLTKHYPTFTLDRVSFDLEPGTIMGFIGRNGAGKTTTLKAIMGLVHPEGGSVRMFGQDFAENELACKRQVGFVLGGVDYYLNKKLRSIADVTRRFYPDWDQGVYEGYLKRFDLDPNKRVKELSAGMKVKFSLALALSHKAKLFLLDEPTSGLDPVSRDELLDIFLDLAADEERGILFSTHITSDLERCADYITYLQNGRVLASTDRETFLETYCLVSGGPDRLTPELEAQLIGCRKQAFGFEAMMLSQDAAALRGLQTAKATLEEIMVHLEREARE